MNITKLELCSRIARKLELQGKKLSANTLETVFESFMDEILTVLTEGRNLELRGFGSFKTKTRKERTGRNPRTGEMVEIPKYQAPIFKFSKDGQKNFDRKLNGSTNLQEYPKKKVYTTKDQPEPPKERPLPDPEASIPDLVNKIAENFNI